MLELKCTPVPPRSYYSIRYGHRISDPFLQPGGHFHSVLGNPIVYIELNPYFPVCRAAGDRLHCIVCFYFEPRPEVEAVPSATPDAAKNDDAETPATTDGAEVKCLH